jgi:hypothetical protein
MKKILLGTILLALIGAPGAATAKDLSPGQLVRES